MMRRTTRGILGTPWSGVILSLLTLGTVMPSTARAGCLTHYITYRSQVNGELPPIDLLGLSGTLLSTESDPPPNPQNQNPNPSPRPRPCTGAMCLTLAPR